MVVWNNTRDGSAVWMWKCEYNTVLRSTTVDRHCTSRSIERERENVMWGDDDVMKEDKRW
jgi:hypothetical protein